MQNPFNKTTLMWLFVYCTVIQLHNHNSRTNFTCVLAQLLFYLIVSFITLEHPVVLYSDQKLLLMESAQWNINHCLLNATKEVTEKTAGSAFEDISQTRKCKQHIMRMHLVRKDGALAIKILQSPTSQAPQLSKFIMMSTFLAPVA